MMICLCKGGAVGRALGAIYNKYKILAMIHTLSCVVPILDYCSSIWDYCNLDKIDTLIFYFYTKNVKLFS